MQDGGAPSGVPFHQSRKAPESDAFDLIRRARLYAGASTSWPPRLTSIAGSRTRMAGERRTEATPFFEGLCPAMATVSIQSCCILR